jgi:hypothetical protein
MFKKIKKFLKKDSDMVNNVLPDTKVSINFTSGDLPNWSIIGGNNKRMVFKIPVGNLSKEDAKKTLAFIISSYKGYNNTEKLEKILNKINHDK